MGMLDNWNEEMIVKKAVGDALNEDRLQRQTDECVKRGQELGQRHAQEEREDKRGFIKPTGHNISINAQNTNPGFTQYDNGRILSYCDDMTGFVYPGSENDSLPPVGKIVLKDSKYILRPMPSTVKSVSLSLMAERLRDLTKEYPKKPLAYVDTNSVGKLAVFDAKGTELAALDNDGIMIDGQQVATYKPYRANSQHGGKIALLLVASKVLAGGGLEPFKEIAPVQPVVTNGTGQLNTPKNNSTLPIVLIVIGFIFPPLLIIGVILLIVRNRK
jgi:hypothetical protein